MASPAVATAAQGDPERGRRLLAQYQGGSCHTIPGVASAGGKLAPTLQSFGLRSYIAGRVANRPELLVRCPPPGAGLPAAGWVLASSILWVLGSACMLWAQRRLGTESQGWLRVAVLLAVACVGVAFALSWSGHVEAGLSPRAQAWSATVAALLAWQGLHAVVLVVMGAYVLARSWSAKLLPQARATLDNTALMWHYTTVQGLAAAALVQGLPRLLA